MTEDKVFAFVTASIPSVWALEVLFLLKREAPQGRSEAGLVSELRSSAGAISISLKHLQAAGLIVEESGSHFYRPAAAALDQLVAEAEKLYALKPTVMIQKIVAAPDDRLKMFADSFRLKE